MLLVRQVRLGTRVLRVKQALLGQQAKQGQEQLDLLELQAQQVLARLCQALPEPQDQLGAQVQPGLPGLLDIQG